MHAINFWKWIFELLLISNNSISDQTKQVINFLTINLTKVFLWTRSSESSRGWIMWPVTCHLVYAFWFGYKPWKLHLSNDSMSHSTRVILLFLAPNCIISYAMESALLLVLLVLIVYHEIINNYIFLFSAYGFSSRTI